MYPMEPVVHKYHEIASLPSGLISAKGHLKDNFMSGGIWLTCDSLSHSNIENCNTRMLKGAIGKATEGLWKSINRLGIINRADNFDPIQRMADMENRDSEVDKVMKGTNNLYP